MRKSIDFIHGWGLRLLGALGLIYVLAILAGIPLGVDADRHLGVSLLVALVGCIACLAFLLPRLTPRWMRYPNRESQGFILVFGLILAQIFVFAPMAAITVAGFQPATAQLEKFMTMAMLPSTSVLLALMITGFTLANLSDPEADDTSDAPA